MGIFALKRGEDVDQEAFKPKLIIFSNLGDIVKNQIGFFIQVVELIIMNEFKKWPISPNA